MALSTAEPDALETLMTELEQLRERAAGLVASTQAAAGDSRPGWRAMAAEVDAAHQRIESQLADAARHDRVRIRLRPPAPQAGPLPIAPRAATLGHCRRLARDLEEQCAAAANHARALGLGAIAAALQRWRCELIGLERPLIVAHAEAQQSER